MFQSVLKQVPFYAFLLLFAWSHMAASVLPTPPPPAKKTTTKHLKKRAGFKKARKNHVTHAHGHDRKIRLSRQHRTPSRASITQPKKNQLWGLIGFAVAMSTIGLIVANSFLFISPVLFILAFAIALGFNIFALIKIHRDENLGGKGWAIAGICISGLLLMFVVVTTVVFLFL